MIAAAAYSTARPGPGYYGDAVSCVDLAEWVEARAGSYPRGEWSRQRGWRGPRPWRAGVLGPGNTGLYGRTRGPNL